MSVKQITAWQTTTGSCYADKAQAYHEEMVWLVRTQGETNRRGFDPTTFNAAIETQQSLVGHLKELKDGLSAKRDGRIVANLDVLLQQAEDWLQQAEVLQAQMEGREVVLPTEPVETRGSGSGGKSAGKNA